MSASNERCCFVDKKLLTKAVNFENQGSLVDFAYGEPVEQITLSTIAIKELDKDVKIPVSYKNIGRLKDIANKSTAGSARYNIHVDPSERHEWEISASAICDPTFIGLGLSSLISCFLRLPTKLMNVKAQLQKLMLHKHGGQSCNKIKNPGCCGVDGKFGTAILQVPVEGGHQGGCFSVEYKGRNQAFENHARSDSNFYITTFFDCCEHFMEPVTQGYQLTLVFDLIWTNAKIRIPQDFPVFLTSLKQVKEVLKSCLIQVKQEYSLDSEDSELEDSESEEIELSAHNTHDFLYSEKELKENIFFFVLHDKYDIENFAFEFLCSQDRKAAELLKSCGFLDVHLAMATHSIQQIYDKDSVDFNSIEKLRWIDSDDVVRNLSIELKSNEHFVGRIEDRFSSSRTKLDQDKKMENRGGNTEKHGVLVIWPKHHSFQMYCRYGLQSLLIRMSKSLLVSAPNWKEETRQLAKNELRQLISFCCAEPEKVWTLAGMENGELTLRLFRFCITLRAREEGIDLLNLVCSNFYEESNDIEKFEGIQTEEVAQIIAEFLCADFVRQVSDWDDVAKLIKRIISSSRIIAKQLIPIVKLGKCFLDLNFKEGAIMIGEAVSSSFTNIDLLKASQSKQSHVESYMDMIVALEMNPETASRERIASFFLFFSKLQLSMQCRFFLDFETRFCSHSKKHPSCQSILCGLCQKILAITCNIYAPSVKCFAVDLVSCFLRLGNAQWLETVISNVCREPTVSESQTFILMKKDLIEKLITSPVIYQLATTSELGQSVMIPLICRSFLPLVEEKSTAMLRREVILEMVRWQSGDESQTHTLLQHVCVNEISGSWAHQEKQKLFRMLISTSDIWANLNSSSKLMVLKTCGDLVLLGISEIKQLLNSSDISNSTSLLVDCVQFFIDVEKINFCDAENNRLITSRVLQQLMTKISTAQLMELVFNLGLSTLSDIKRFPLCIDWYRNACQLFFQQDFVHLVNSVGDGVKKIFDCLLWLNDELCWESFKVQICKSFPSEVGNLFVHFVISNEALQETLVGAPLGLNVFNRILDHWIEESSPKENPPAVDWSMSQTSFPACPEVETCLRSSEESMTYSKFRGIKEARQLGKLLDKSGPKNGVSVHSSVGGLGKNAFYEIEKKNCDDEIALKTFHARQSELWQVEKLRIDLQERVKSISKTEIQLPLPVDFSLAVLPTMPTDHITSHIREILPMNMQNEMGIPNIKVENEKASGCLILSAESELFPSTSATYVATEHIQEEKSEENHDYPPLTPPNEAPSSDSTSCGIFPDAGPSIDFQDGHMVSVGDIHQKSSSESIHSLPTYLPSVAALKEAAKKACDWNSRLEVLQKLEYSPYLEALESLMSKAKSIAIRLDSLDELENQIAAAHAWRERTAKTFLRKNSYYSLIEVLSPKLDVLVASRFRRRRPKEDPFNPINVTHVITLEAEKKEDPRLIVEAFKESENNELTSFKRIRVQNIQKKVHDDQGLAHYCICQGKAQGGMIECALCKEWFHLSCLRGAKQQGPGAKNETNGKGNAISGIKDGRYLCGYCCRSRRPRLETILSLLVSLQKLPVRLPEGEALQCLTERAMNWQDRARQLLSTEELTACLSQLSTMLQRATDASSRKKMDGKTGSNELQKLSVSGEHRDFFSGSEESQDSECTARDSIPEVVEQPPALSNSEHAYSSFSRDGSGCMTSNKKNVRKSPLVPRQLNSSVWTSPSNNSSSCSQNVPLITLSSQTAAKLEDLILEGDSLEVSLDETIHIGRILQAIKAPSEPPVMALLYSKDEEQDCESNGDSFSKKKMQGKKRKLDPPGDKQTPRGPKGNKNTKTMKGNKKPRMMKKLDGKKRQSNNESENDEDCAADQCLKPTGKEVIWVQCDGGCEMWFHLRCVGLQARDVKANEDYICRRCAVKNPPAGDDDIDKDEQN